MSGKFKWKNFSDVDLNDKFFDSLKSDYAEFSQWFSKKQKDGEKAFVYDDEQGVGAFLYLKKKTRKLLSIIELYQKSAESKLEH